MKNELKLCKDESNLRECFVKLLNMAKPDSKETNQRFITYLDVNGFFEAPASSKFHLNCEGGLLEHTINVAKNVLELHEISQFKNTTYRNEALFCALVHDIGKIGWNGKRLYESNVLKSGEISKAKPYTISKNVLQIDHEELSLFHVMRFYDLSDDEIFTIENHNGAYGRNKYNLAGKETPLMLLVHFADMIAARIDENEFINEKLSF